MSTALTAPTNSAAAKPPGVAWFTALRDHGVPCELVLYDGEGHLFSRPHNKADMFTRAVAWFHQHQPSSR